MFLKENIKIIDNISLLEDIINFNEEYYNIKNDIILEEYKILVEGETFDKLKEKAKNLYTIIVNFLKRMWEKLKQVYYTIKNKIFFTWENIIKKVNKEKEGSMFEVYDIDGINITVFEKSVASGDFNAFTNVDYVQKNKSDFNSILIGFKNYFNELIKIVEYNLKIKLDEYSNLVSTNKEDYTFLDSKKVEISKFMLDSQKQITNIMKLNSLLISKVSKYKIVELPTKIETEDDDGSKILILSYSKYFINQTGKSLSEIIDGSNLYNLHRSNIGGRSLSYEWIWFGDEKNRPKPIGDLDNRLIFVEFTISKETIKVSEDYGISRLEIMDFFENVDKNPSIVLSKRYGTSKFTIDKEHGWRMA